MLHGWVLLLGGSQLWWFSSWLSCKATLQNQTPRRLITCHKPRRLISRSFMLFHSSGEYLAVKVGPNHLGRLLPVGASTFQPKSPGATPCEYLLITFS